MRIALIGGSGFIGTRLTRLLLESGHEVRILDIARSQTYPNLWMEADVRDRESLLAGLSGCTVAVNLAAEHRDDVTPRSRYDEVNVGGARNVCAAAEDSGIKRMIFTSSVAVYGFAPPDTDESGQFQPFNDYGRTKMLAEVEYSNWQEREPDRSLVIVRPTVVFGEDNRGNVYNLLKQMAAGTFLMVGRGTNVKSMAYVENVAAFLEFNLTADPGIRVFNYIDKPDFDMNSLVALVRRSLGKSDTIGLRLPFWMGYLAGRALDVVASATGRKFPISGIRVKKFCMTTQFRSTRMEFVGFRAPTPLEEGLRKTIDYEFLSPKKRETPLFYSE